MKYSEIVDNGDTEIPTIRGIVVVSTGGTYQRLDEGKWISGRFPGGIRLDQPTHLQGAGQVHAHVYDRKGNELLAVNFDGTARACRQFAAMGHGRLHRGPSADELTAFRGPG
jgi:hypothetical protein